MGSIETYVLLSYMNSTPRGIHLVISKAVLLALKVADGAVPLQCIPLSGALRKWRARKRSKIQRKISRNLVNWGQKLNRTDFHPH